MSFDFTGGNSFYTAADGNIIGGGYTLPFLPQMSGGGGKKEGKDAVSNMFANYVIPFGLSKFEKDDESPIHVEKHISDEPVDESLYTKLKDAIDIDKKEEPVPPPMQPKNEKINKHVKTKPLKRKGKNKTKKS